MNGREESRARIHHSAFITHHSLPPALAVLIAPSEIERQRKFYPCPLENMLWTGYISTRPGGVLTTGAPVALSQEGEPYPAAWPGKKANIVKEPMANTGFRDEIDGERTEAVRQAHGPEQSRRVVRQAHDPERSRGVAGILLYFEDFEPKPVGEFGRKPKFYHGLKNP